MAAPIIKAHIRMETTHLFDEAFSKAISLLSNPKHQSKPTQNNSDALLMKK